MKTRSELYGKEVQEILRLITLFKVLELRQLIKMYPDKEKKVYVMLKNLISQGRIYKDSKTLLIADSEASLKSPDEKIIKAFWVFLEFKDKADYYLSGEFPVIISFFSKGEAFEILYVPFDNETMVNYILSQSANDTKKLVIVEEQKQSEKLDIPNLLCFCLVSQDGIVELFRLE